MEYYLYPLACVRGCVVDIDISRKTTAHRHVSMCLWLCCRHRRVSTEGRRLLKDVSQCVCGCVVDIDECLLKEDDCSQTCLNVSVAVL